MHEQQHAAGRDGREQRALGRGVGGTQQGRVLRGDEVEGRRRERRLRQARVHPANGDTGVARMRGRPLQRHARDLERGHVPAPAREPDGVRALAAADVEHPTGREPGDLGHQRAVGPAAPQLLLFGVPAVPFRLHRGVSDVSVGRRGTRRTRSDALRCLGHRLIVAFASGLATVVADTTTRCGEQPVEIVVAVPGPTQSQTHFLTAAWRASICGAGPFSCADRVAAVLAQHGVAGLSSVTSRSACLGASVHRGASAGLACAWRRAGSRMAGVAVAGSGGRPA